MATKETLYSSFKQIRERQQQPFYRVLLSGYFNDEEVKKQSINPQKYLKSTITPYLNPPNPALRGYLYIKGLFYLHLLQSKDIDNINKYLQALHELTLREPQVHSEIRVVHQSYECPFEFFRGWECDSVVQPGPVLVETDKTEEQILNKSLEIYESIEEGAKRKKQTPSHKIANMFVLSNDDMSILLSKNFMSLPEYNEIYIVAQENRKQCESNYPLPPNIFNTIEFLEISDYARYQ